uniref:Uncharacterized protein n=1 Tax=Magallana gigas TaxID=29159 RepID=K1PNB7_MAGGI
MHHHPPNQERALNLSILTVFGPVSATRSNSVKSTKGLQPRGWVRTGSDRNEADRQPGPEIQLRAF